MMKLANTYGVNVLTEEKKRTMECLNYKSFLSM